MTRQPPSAPVHHLARIEPIGPDDGPEVRRFCLEVIDEVFGYGYRPDWHRDLDELCQPRHDYHPARRGTFLVARSDGKLVGCAGLRALSSKPSLAGRFSDRYPDPSRTGSIWRACVAPDFRSAGLGAALNGELERRAATLGYDDLYLHTTGTSTRSVRFWQRQGYRIFCHDTGSADATVHMDKPLGSRADRLETAVMTGELQPTGR